MSTRHKYILHLPFGPLKLAERIAHETGGRVIPSPWRVEYATRRAMKRGEELHDRIKAEFFSS